MGRLEILAPAGNAEMLRAAVFGGADAVYLGLTGFNARRTAGNFTPEELGEAVRFCHARGVRVHVTLNTLVFDAELDALAAAVRAVAAAGADAVIADDLAAARLVKEIAPALELHGSTQMSIHTAAGAVELARLGFDRVILARELSLEEIRAVCAASPIACEVFVHGALCVSMSGQCMMSAFLGGRSGNRGACAGPCRLPFDAARGLRPGQPGRACSLSLKEMDHIPHLRALMDAGVASVKIEGRLRTPEYAAVCAASCRAVRDGLPYDAALLRDIFSRSGFTDGYLTGRADGSLFGVRTEADAAATRAAAPKARELFRRELQRVPVDFTVAFDAEGVKLTAADREGRKAVVYSREAPRPAQRDQSEAVRRALAKTGGTPFVCGTVALDLPEGTPSFLPGAAWNELRRRALDTLLEKRSAPAPHPVRDFAVPVFPARAPGGVPALAARFERAEQVPADCGALAALTLPLAELESARRLPAGVRAKTLLELPRAQFGAAERRVAALLAQAADDGFAGFVVNNLCQLELAARAGAGPLYGGLGLNVTNPMAAAELRAPGLHGVLLHPETPLSAMRSVTALPTAALCYGHLPLMLTRACPLRTVQDCAACKGGGTLRDRKGRDFTVTCSAPGTAGMRTVYNPVPLYMGDRLTELPVDCAAAYFTTESPDRVRRVLALLAAGRPFDGEFTRGAYY